MLAIFGKKKISEQQVAQLFVKNTLDVVDRSWPILREFIIDSPEFISTPEVKEEDYGKFLMIIIAGNISYIPKYFKNGHDKEIIRKSVEFFADIFEETPESFARKLRDCKTFLSRVNIPSKNMKLAIPKGIFYKYNLNQYQESYFKNLKSPNPIFLKNLMEITSHFIWDWEGFNEKYKVQEHHSHA